MARSSPPYPTPKASSSPTTGALAPGSGRLGPSLDQLGDEGDRVRAQPGDRQPGEGIQAEEDRRVTDDRVDAEPATYRKLGISSRAQAVAWSVQHGSLVDAER